MFLDVDEYVLLNYKSQLIEKFHNCVETNILGSIFINWYIHPNLRKSNIVLDHILKDAINGKLRGYLLRLYDNIVYKHNIIRYTNDDISKLNNYKILPGYHRILQDGNIVLPKKEDYLITHHIKGIPDKYSIPRLRNRFLELSNCSSEDFNLQHFKYEKNIIDNYEYHYYNNCNYIDEILNEIEKEYASKDSLDEFETIIIPEILKILK